MAQGRRVCGSIDRLTGAAANKPSSNGVVQSGGNTPMARRKTRRSRRSRQTKRGRGATARNGRPRRLIPTAVLQKTHKAVRPLFRAGIGVDQFVSQAKALTARQRARI